MIPVFEPEIGEEEIQAVVSALRRGEISGSGGSDLERFEAEFAAFCGRHHAVAVNSGTGALQIAVEAAGIGPGDEVLVSASTNIASALAVVRSGATVVPVDSEPRSWNLDLDLLESLITPKTRAIIPVHLYGHPVDMRRLEEIAARHELTVIEDCAEAHGALCHGRKAGSFGAMSCFSFYASKMITTGEGGCIVTDSPEYAERLRLLRNLGFTTPRFRHEVAGYNLRMTNLQAAMGLAQLRKLPDFISAKRRLAQLYHERLAGTPGLQLPAEEEWAKSVFWMYAVVVGPEFGTTRDDLMADLKRRGIDSRTFFCPMNQQPCLLHSGLLKKTDCPVSDRLWEQGLYLPSGLKLDADAIGYICDSVRSARGAASHR